MAYAASQRRRVPVAMMPRRRRPIRCLERNQMHRFALRMAIAVILAGTASADAATRKKARSGETASRSAQTMAKQKRHQVRRPPVPWNQQWPTSFSDGSFRYGD